MNNQVTSKEKIIEECLEIVSKEGIEHINMRNVAKKCDVALGSIYNYYPSKAALLMDVVKKVWDDIFDFEDKHFDNFIDCIESLYEDMSLAYLKYPMFLKEHAKMANKVEGMKMMGESFAVIKKVLLEALNNDKNINKDCFDDLITRELYVEFIFTLFIENLGTDKNILISFIKKYLY